MTRIASARATPRESATHEPLTRRARFALGLRIPRSTDRPLETRRRPPSRRDATRNDTTADLGNVAQPRDLEPGQPLVARRLDHDARALVVAVVERDVLLFRPRRKRALSSAAKERGRGVGPARDPSAIPPLGDRIFWSSSDATLCSDQKNMTQLELCSPRLKQVFINDRRFHDRVSATESDVRGWHLLHRHALVDEEACELVPLKRAVTVRVDLERRAAPNQSAAPPAPPPRPQIIARVRERAYANTPPPPPSERPARSRSPAVAVRC